MEERVLQVNNTALYVFPNEYLHSFCIAVYARAGSIYESKSNNGITHLLEHAIFRNISNKFDGNLYDLLALNGLSFSGSTYKEFLCFSIEGPSHGFSFACEVLISIFDTLSISISELSHEKRRIKAEIREKAERNSIRYLFSKKVWSETDGDKTVLGSCKMLDRTSRKALEDYRRKIFSGGNCFFYATGCVTDENLQLLTQKISLLDIEISPVFCANTIGQAGSFFHRDSAIGIKNGVYCSVHMGFDIDASKYSLGTLDLLYGILFTGDNALLFRHLSEFDPLVYSYDSVHEQYNNIGCFCFDFEVTPDTFEDSIARVVDALCDLKAGNFNFEANLNYELSNWILMLDKPSELNWNLAYNNHILDAAPIQYSCAGLGRFASVIKDGVMDAAKEIFSRANLTILLTGPKRNIDTECLNSILDRLDPRE